MNKKRETIISLDGYVVEINNEKYILLKIDNETGLKTSKSLFSLQVVIKAKK